MLTVIVMETWAKCFECTHTGSVFLPEKVKKGFFLPRLPFLDLFYLPDHSHLSLKTHPDSILSCKAFCYPPHFFIRMDHSNFYATSRSCILPPSVGLFVFVFLSFSTLVKTLCIEYWRLSFEHPGNLEYSICE